MIIKGKIIKGKLMFAHNCLFTKEGIRNEQSFYLLQSGDGTVTIVQTETLANGQKVYSRRQDACIKCHREPKNMPQQKSWDKIPKGRYEIFD